MKVGEIVEGRITDMNAYGAGVMKNAGVVIFVEGAVTGDFISAEITEAKKNCAFARIVEIKEPSEHRVAPVCPCAGECGGCLFCGVDAKCENAAKRGMVVSALRSAGLGAVEVGETVSSPERTGYRNKITLHMSEMLGVNGEFGLYREGTNDAVRFSRCPLVSEEMNRAVNAVNELCGGKFGRELRSYSPHTLAVRSSAGGLNLSLYHNTGRIPDGMKRELADVTGAEVFVTDGSGNGSGYYEDVIAKIPMRFSTEAFRQVNTGAFERLLECVGELTDGLDFTSAADLYCGSGIIGLYLAKRRPGTEIWGVEINPSAVRDAEYNAVSAGISNAHYFCGDAASFPEHTGVHPELCIVDPPRAGLSDSMRSVLCALNPTNIIYVSCNPRTLARDLKDLTAHGYRAVSATPVNVFAMTGHVETVVRMAK